MIPKGYVVDEMPKSIIYNLPSKAGSFQYISSVINNIIQLVVKIQINQLVYQPEDYATVKDFYDPDPKFCYSGFNHMILYIPSEKIWLECTADDLPTGYLSTFTQGRGVLVLSDSSGKLMRTPALDTTTNVKNTKSVIQLAIDGSATLKNSSVLTGSMQDQWRSWIKNLSKEDIEKRFQQFKKLPSFKINKLETTADRKNRNALHLWQLCFKHRENGKIRNF